MRSALRGEIVPGMADPTTPVTSGNPTIPALDDFVGAARRWLDANARRRERAELVWGEGSDSVAILAVRTPEEARAAVDEVRAWQRRKVDAGYGAISWPVEVGGAGLPRAHEDAFRRLESAYDVPRGHEAVTISLEIEAPTIQALGTHDQRARWLPGLLRADLVCCQLFSEPGAGSDLGSIATRAVRDGDTWVVDGQKVWTTGAQFSDLGYLLARTDPTAPRQAALTAFVVDMRSPGVEVRPLRQMSGGASFNEVFLSGVRVPDADRLGEVGGGWGAAMTTLGFERVAATSGSGGPPLFDRLLLTARHAGRHRDPIVRQELARVYIDARLRSLTLRRAAAGARRDGRPGPEGSIAKLAYSRGLQHLGAVAGLVLGPQLVADTGVWGTYAWNEVVTGAAGLRIAGGTDEIQRNTIAERVLGLPKEPRPRPVREEL
jgi:alkylation response protein AidB-like acyl-CoA dehydrogenase